MADAQSFVAIGVSLFLGGAAGLWAGLSTSWAFGERIGSSVAAGNERGPAAAAEWALSIGAESGRQRRIALETVAAAWFKANPGEARAWVEQAPLSGPEYFQLTGRPRSK